MPKFLTAPFAEPAGTFTTLRAHASCTLPGVRLLAIGLPTLLFVTACSLLVSLDGLGGNALPPSGFADASPLAEVLVAEAAAPDASLRIRIAPASVTLDPGGKMQFAATITPAGAATWSVKEGAAGGIVSADGLYTAPYAAGTFHVLAAVQDAAVAIATVTVLPSLMLLAGRPDGHADGTGRAARFRLPSGCAVDSSGNVYVSDRNGQTLRKVSPGGVVSTLAGTPGLSGIDDGAGLVAKFNQPSGTAVDGAGNVYLAEIGSHTVRKITPAGVVSTFAGTPGVLGKSDGVGTAARFYSPISVAVDTAGNVYVSDYGNHAIRVISPAGVVSTLAGLPGTSGSADGPGTSARFSYPDGIAVDANGNVYVADEGNLTIRKVTPEGVVSTLAGTPNVPGYLNGNGAAAKFGVPTSVTVDQEGTLYVTDFGNNVLRKLTASGDVTTFAGSVGSAQVDGAQPGFYRPHNVCADKAGNLFVAEYEGRTVRKVTPDGMATTLAGLATYGDADGDGEAASFRYLSGIAVDGDGNAYVSDYYASAIRKITASGTVTTFAGMKNVAGSLNGKGTAALFNSPQGIAVGSDSTVYVADSGNRVVRKISPTGEVSTTAGLAGSSASVDGVGANARFNYPLGVAVDPATQVLYVTEYGEHTVRAISAAGVVTTIAGQKGVPGFANGEGATATFRNPRGVTVDSAGNVLIADGGNHTVRRITKSGAVSTIGGVAGAVGSTDGTASLFWSPFAMAADVKGNVFVGEYTNRDVRRMIDTQVSTVAGNPRKSELTVLGALPGSLRAITGVAVQSSGTLLVTTTSAVYRIVGSF